MNNDRATLGLRCAASLRNALEELAALHHCSVNQYCVRVLAEHSVMKHNLRQPAATQPTNAQQVHAMHVAGM
jgi:hypothetical protein